MENKKTSETLEEGFVETKTENPCNEILEEVDSLSLCNLSEMCTADVYNGKREVNHVDLTQKPDNGGVEESCLSDGIDGNNQISKGYLDNKLLLQSNGDEMKDNDVPLLEGDLTFNGNDRFQICKVDQSMEKSDDVLHSDELDEPMEKGEHVLHPHEPSSPTKIEVSGSGINLFVEVFGPLDGISESNNNPSDMGGHVLGDRESNQEYSLQENGSIFSGVKNVSTKNEGEDIVGEQEKFTFDVGDLVWVKTRTPLWWPGTISDPSDAPSDATKRGNFLVKYFGNANFVWCDYLDLKPFLEYFEQMSGQNNSRSFFGSVEKALCEIGRRVKSNMTCPCFSKDNIKENSMSMEKRSKFDVLSSLSQFEPATFLANIRHVASSVHVPSKIELTVMKNCVSAYYRSIGHCELPLHLLRSGTDDAQVIDEGHKNSTKARDGDLTVSRREKRTRNNDADLVGNKTASSGKGFESRERKKSKYLSYPYVETEDTNHRPILSTKPTSLGNNSGTNSRKKGSRKPVKGHHHLVCKATDDINASSAELLAELCSSASDCSYLSRSKYSDSLKTFYTSFRKFAFLNADVASKDAGGQQAPVLEKCRLQDSTEAEVKEHENESVENTAGKKSSKTENPKAKGNGIIRKTKKKKEQEISAGPESINSSFSLGTNVYPSGSWMISFQQACSDVPTSQTTPKNRDGDSIAKLPDLNGNNSSFSVDHFPVGPPSVNLSELLPEQRKEGLLPPSTNLTKLLPEQRQEGLVSPSIVSFDKMVFTSVPSLKEAEVTIQSIPQLNNGTNCINQFLNEQFTTNELGSNVINMGLGSFVQQSQPKLRKRKRKEKTSEAASVIPDLNGIELDMSSLEGQPQKKSRIKPANGEPGSNGEALGGSLLLNFAPGFALPSKETLVAIFSRFGLLKESEIQVINESTVQIAYERSSEARFAYRSLEKSNPLGESLVSFKLHCMPASSKTKERKNKLQMPKPFVPVDPSKNRAKPGETLDIAFIRQNVEMMKSTLEKAGDSLSPEMRAKLENEIKVFLDKISSMTGSSSSS